jgi:septal ring factor EnvC (AmiA/AmiB activator)
MGRVAEFKNEQIIKVGIELESRGEDVTTSAIRKMLGGGSSTRIKAIWKDYLKDKAEQNELEQSEVTLELPPELQSVFESQSEVMMSALRNYVQKTFATSENISEMKVKARIQEYSSRIDRFEKAEDEALAEVDACEERIVVLTDERLLLSSENDELKKSNAQLMGQIKRLEESAKKQDEVAIKYESLLKVNGRLQYMIDNTKKSEGS